MFLPVGETRGHRFQNAGSSSCVAAREEKQWKTPLRVSISFIISLALLPRERKKTEIVSPEISFRTVFQTIFACARGATFLPRLQLGCTASHNEYGFGSLRGTRLRTPVRAQHSTCPEPVETSMLNKFPIDSTLACNDKRPESRINRHLDVG